MSTEILYCTQCDEWAKQLAAINSGSHRSVGYAAGCSHTVWVGEPGSTKEKVAKETPDEWEWRKP